MSEPVELVMLVCPCHISVHAATVVQPLHNHYTTTSTTTTTTNISMNHHTSRRHTDSVNLVTSLTIDNSFPVILSG